MASSSRKDTSLERKYYQSVPFRRLWALYAAVFCLFAITGLLGDIFSMGRLPYLLVGINTFLSGFVAIMYLHVGTRLTPRYFLHVSLLQIPLWLFFSFFVTFLKSHYNLESPDSITGIRVAGLAMMALVIISYSLFIRFFRGEGQESFRIRNELDLAHGIQKTLVPPIEMRTQQFEIYGRSDPSDKVGGDLVDVVSLEDGSTVAYLADIAGHGLQAGILMGMVKTAARTALLDERHNEPCSILPSLMERLNRVLPGVKEPQMYATFAGFCLNADGSVFYSLAAHPPILHYSTHVAENRARELSAEQFPLGLLPVSGFSSEVTNLTPGDLLISVTDGILEVCDEKEEEFGMRRLQSVITANAAASLPAMADAILREARKFGKQIDDQTLLLIRRL